MMEALKVMTYFKVSLSTHNWDSAIKKPRPWPGLDIEGNRISG
jgi:hypothetical protein